MRPAEVFWNRLINPLPTVANQNCVQAIALRMIALVGLVFSTPTYFIGWTCKIISRFFEIGGDSLDSIQQRIALAVLEETRSLEQVRLFAREPTWENYRTLPLDQKCLIAGRHLYPRYGLWHFLQKSRCVNIFEHLFRDRPNLANMHQATREATRIQEKILFVHQLRQMVLQKANFIPLAHQDWSTFCQALHYVAKEYDCRNDEEVMQIGIKALQKQSSHLKTDKALEDLVYWLKKGYVPEDPLMRAEPVR